jgi:DNA repair exonuclease SbcCD nuclease subunit
MDSIDKSKLPLADYYAMGHIHQVFQKKETKSYYVYPGPIFPNNFQELKDLKYGSFQVSEIDVAGEIVTKNIKIPLKEVAYKEIELDNGLTATEKIISEIDKLSLNNKIFLLKLKGILTQGKTGDIRFNEIEEFVKKKLAHVFLRNISTLKIQESEIELESGELGNVENIEEKIIEEYTVKNPADFNKFLPEMMNALSIDKNEDEKSIIFENRLIDELKKILNLQEVI